MSRSPGPRSGGMDLWVTQASSTRRGGSLNLRGSSRFGPGAEQPGAVACPSGRPQRLGHESEPGELRRTVLQG
ncbi:MAG: hypothetical protein RMK29_03245 [Myxococcales bacterium]|nr:hypothetical protein [Myxococcales bacterium]